MPYSLTGRYKINTDLKWWCHNVSVTDRIGGDDPLDILQKLLCNLQSLVQQVVVWVTGRGTVDQVLQATETNYINSFNCTSYSDTKFKLSRDYNHVVMLNLWGEGGYG